MNFIRDNILKILGGIVLIIILLVVIFSCSNEEVVSVSNYTQIENELQQAAIKYARKNKNILPKSEENISKIQMSTVYSEKKMQKITAIEDKNAKCQGYVNVYVNNTGGYKFVPFIKCGKYYQTKTIAEKILENEEIVTKGDGLYQDKEDYLFRGEYPNNYINIGEHTYRIMNITSDNYLRVIADSYISDSYVWDDRYNSDTKRYDGINDFEKSRIKKSLENLFESDYFSDDEKNVMVKHEICVGRRGKDDATIAKDYECDETLNDMYISLPVPEDYFRPSLDSGCDFTSKSECTNYNYFSSMRIRTHTLTASKDDTYSIFMLNSGGLSYRKASEQTFINPVFYIDNNLIYSSGDGSESNPYLVR